MAATKIMALCRERVNNTHQLGRLPLWHIHQQKVPKAAADAGTNLQKTTTRCLRCCCRHGIKSSSELNFYSEHCGSIEQLSQKSLSSRTSSLYESTTRALSHNCRCVEEGAEGHAATDQAGKLQIKVTRQNHSRPNGAQNS